MTLPSGKETYFKFKMKEPEEVEWKKVFCRVIKEEIFLFKRKKDIKNSTNHFACLKQCKGHMTARDEGGYSILLMGDGEGNQYYFRSLRKNELFLFNNLAAPPKNPRELGRPLAFSPHTTPKAPFLTSENLKQNYEGLFNLLVIYLIATHLRLCLRHIMSYGILINFFSAQKITDSSVFLCFLALGIPVIFAFIIEILASWRVSNYIIFPLVSVEFTFTLAVPLYVIQITDASPLVGFALLTIASIVSMKLVSFHHVWNDVRVVHAKIGNQRKSLSRKYSQPEIDEIEESKEYNEFDLPKEIYDYASAYPKNLKLKGLCYFMVIPTLCFQLMYPQTKKIRIGFVVEKLIALLFSTVIMVALTEQFLFHYVEAVSQHIIQGHYLQILEKVLTISVPWLYVWLLSFYSLFHCGLNILAELTFFADKQFYLGWWNSQSIAEYWRTWNLPVHYWCLRHIYYPLKRRKISSIMASFCVFFISALYHEYILSGSMKFVGVLAFLAMMGNLPVMMIQDKLKPFIKGTQLNNIAFWIGFCIVGQPICLIIYYMKWVENQQNSSIA